MREPVQPNEEEKERDGEGEVRAKSLDASERDEPARLLPAEAFIY